MLILTDTLCEPTQENRVPTGRITGHVANYALMNTPSQQYYIHNTGNKKKAPSSAPNNTWHRKILNYIWKRRLSYKNKHLDSGLLHHSIGLYKENDRNTYKKSEGKEDR